MRLQRRAGAQGEHSKNLPLFLLSVLQMNTAVGPEIMLSHWLFDSPEGTVKLDQVLAYALSSGSH
jgi:hypothetical protein